jgi:hypothetical protein
VLADADLLAEPDDRTLSPKLILAGLLAHRYLTLAERWNGSTWTVLHTWTPR